MSVVSHEAIIKSVEIERRPLPVLTAIRFFAAADVVLYHSEFRSEIHNQFLQGIASSGYDAVTLFFVLSGFIITYVYWPISSNRSLAHPINGFLKARFARIVPAYILALSIAMPHFWYSAFITKIISIQSFLTSLILVPVLAQAW
jgi:peptidoglycan/LPS O-acetylase OafA/YrhL